MFWKSVRSDSVRPFTSSVISNSACCLPASPAGITLLSHLPAVEEAEAAAAPAAAPRMSFAEAFQQVLTRKQ